MDSSDSRLLSLQAQLDGISSHIKELLRNPSSVSVQQLEDLDTLTTASQATLTHVQRDVSELHNQLAYKTVELKYKSESLCWPKEAYERPSPLSLAIRAKDIEGMRVLVESEGITIQKKDETRRMKVSSPLHLAAAAGFDEGVKFLLDEKNADIDMLDIDGETPLSVAIDNKKASTVSLLLRRGATVDIHDLCKPMNIFVEENVADVEILRLLLEYGADLDDVQLPFHEYSALSWKDENLSEGERNRITVGTILRRQGVHAVALPPWYYKVTGENPHRSYYEDDDMDYYNSDEDSDDFSEGDDDFDVYDGFDDFDDDDALGY